jgi:cyclomaltodextrinase / maltogenic alpha-amylase / neopullulanase
MYYNSWDENYKKPFGACAAGSEITFAFDDEIDAEVTLIIYNESDKLSFDMKKTNKNICSYTYIWHAPSYTSLWWYYFKVEAPEETRYYGNNVEALGGKGQEYEETPVPYQLTLYKAETKVPQWYREGIIYQIFVDRFFNGSEEKETFNPKPEVFFKRDWDDKPKYIKDEKGNVIKYDYFGGNLEGIIEKLPYLKSLGVSILYLNPVFEAWSNHKYNTADYMKIDSMYGDKDIFKKFISECNKQGINVILDGVFNHTGIDSVYFNYNKTYDSIGAFNSKESPYYEWYMFKNYPQDYETWWGIKNMPTLNKDSKEYRDFLMHNKNSVIHHWMEQGVKGWRLDVVDELPDNFVEKLREEVKAQDSESVILGEVWEDASNKISYGVRRKYFLGEELDSVMNYPFRNIILLYINGDISGEQCYKKLMNLHENYPEEYFYSTMNLLGSHDVPRLLTALGGETDYDKAFLRLKMAVLLQVTFPGVPSIYYGDEAGLKGGTDPENRGTYPWGRENLDILSWYKYASNLRTSIPEMRNGKWSPLYGDNHVFAYMRHSEGNQYVMLYNNDEIEHTVSIPFYDYKLCNNYRDLISNKERELISNKLVISIATLDFRILKFEGCTDFC